MKKNWIPPLQWYDADGLKRTLITVVTDGPTRLVASKRQHPKKREWDYMLEPEERVDFHITKLSKGLNKTLRKVIANNKLHANKYNVQ